MKYNQNKEYKKRRDNERETNEVESGKSMCVHVCQVCACGCNCWQRGRDRLSRGDVGGAASPAMNEAGKENTHTQNIHSHSYADSSSASTA